MEIASTPATFLDIVFRLCLAVLLGAAVGIDRELRRKPAGLRTHALVALGCAMSMVLGMSLVPGAQAGEAAGRVVQGILAGIGFIGGGVILRDSARKTIEGLTTAALIWVVAAVGLCAGAGMWRSATLTVGLALALALLGGPVEAYLHRFRRDERELPQ
jgi:putative Mg2+ transporter-C (MgtC) family protein